jgi:hypothetical protein
VKPIALILACLLMSVAAPAQTYSNASLSGNYSVQFGTPAYDYWSKTFVCPTNSTVSYTAYGSITTMGASLGVASFNGAGAWSFSVTNTGRLNATASANTMSVTWNSSCQVTSVNNGHVVYVAAATQTGTGTYSVSSSGAATVKIKGQTNTFTLQLAATDSAGVSNTALWTGTQANGSSIGSGIAVHQ